MLSPNLKLNTGATIPALGLGTWQSQPGQVRAAVSHAIQHGYRHIDCAYAYGNEGEVGLGIRDGLAATGLKREALFITTKLWCTYHTRVEQNLDLSLNLLDLDYVDLYLMHWPVAMNGQGNHEKFPTLANGTRDIDWTQSHIETWKDMEKLVRATTNPKVRAIGVCNYSARYLSQLLPHTTIVPAVNQIENHPLLPQQEIVDLCRSENILITAYSPLGSTGSPLMKNRHVVHLAQQKNTTASAILLSYHIARGSAVLAKSVSPARIEENAKGMVSLDQDELALLERVPAEEGGLCRFVYPEFGVDFGFPDKQQQQQHEEVLMQ